MASEIFGRHFSFRLGYFRTWGGGWLAVLTVAGGRGMPGRRERRYRLTIRVPVAFQGAGRRFVGMLVDISLTGLLARCDQQIEAGTMLRAAIEAGHEVFRATVTARRPVPNVGIAFEFQTMGWRDRQKLHVLLTQISKALRK